MLFASPSREKEAVRHGGADGRSSNNLKRKQIPKQFLNNIILELRRTCSIMIFTPISSPFLFWALVNRKTLESCELQKKTCLLFP
jgi:hypothetical protein